MLKDYIGAGDEKRWLQLYHLSCVHSFKMVTFLDLICCFS